MVLLLEESKGIPSTLNSIAISYRNLRFFLYPFLLEKQQSSNHRAPSFPADQPIFPHPIPRRNDAGGSRDEPGRESANGSGRHPIAGRSEEHTSELQSQFHLVCRLLLEKH